MANQYIIFSLAFKLSAQAELMWGIDGIYPSVRLSVRLSVHPVVNVGPHKSRQLDLQISYQGQLTPWGTGSSPILN